MQDLEMSCKVGRLDDIMSVQHPNLEPSSQPVHHRKRNKFKWWNSLWFNEDLESRVQLRSKYQYDFKRYRQAYRPDDEELLRLLEQGMRWFTRLTKIEERLVFKSRLEPFRNSGKHSLHRLCQAFGDDTSNIDLDIVLVCVDFEGALSQKSLNEYGLASIAFTPEVSSADALLINTSTFTLVSDRGRQTLWGEVTRTTVELLPRYIRSDFEEFTMPDCKREVILVCHGLENDMRTLDDLGIPFEDLSITGLLDTHTLAQEVLGFPCGLEKLLGYLNIHVTPHSLHSAGNDAHYTLQALFGLMQRKYDSQLAGIDKLVRSRAPKIRHWVTPAGHKEEGWESNLDGDLWAAFS
jgi:hypothetical protein